MSIETSFLRKNELLFFDDLQRKDDGTIKTDVGLSANAQIGGLAPIPKDHNYAASKAYVDSVAANIEPKEAVDYVSYVTRSDFLFDVVDAQGKLYYTDGVRDANLGQGSDYLSDNGYSRVKNAAEVQKAFRIAGVTVDTEGVISLDTTNKGAAFNATHAFTVYEQGQVMTFDVNNYNDNEELQTDEKKFITQTGNNNGEHGTASHYLYLRREDKDKFTQGSYWSLDEVGSRVVEIESDPQELSDVRQSVWRVKVIVGGTVPGAFGQWAPIDPTNGTPYALYPVSFGGIPNIFKRDGIISFPITYSSPHESVQLTDTPVRLLLVNWGGTSKVDADLLGGVHSSNHCNGVWEVKYEGSKFYYRRPSDWGGQNEDIAPMAWIEWTLSENFSPTWARTMYRYDETTGIWYHKIPANSADPMADTDDTVVDSATKAVASGTRRTLILQAEVDETDALGLEFLGSIVSGNDAIQPGTTVTHISISDDQLTVTVTLSTSLTDDINGIDVIFTPQVDEETLRVKLEDQVPVENAMLEKGAYTTVCCGIGDTSLGRGSAFVLGSIGDGKGTVTNADNEFDVFLFKAANLDFEEFDSGALMLNADSKLTFARGDAEQVPSILSTAIGLQPGHLSKTFLNWLDSRASSGGFSGGDVTSTSVLVGSTDKALVLVDQNGITMRDHAQRTLFRLLEENLNDDVSDTSMFSFTLSSVITQDTQKKSDGTTSSNPTSRKQFSTVPRLEFGGDTQDFVILDSGEQLVETQRLLQQHQILKVEASTGIVTLGAPLYAGLVDPDVAAWVQADSPKDNLRLSFQNRDGTFQVTKAGAVTAQQLELTSDIRHKQNIEIARHDECLDAIRTIDSLTYTLPHTSRRLRGVSAQSVRAVLPEAVSENAEAKLSVDYAALTSALCGAVNALRARVETLEGMLKPAASL